MYRVILTYNGKYKKTLHKCHKRSTVFKRYHKLKEENKKIMFPKKFINTHKIKPVKYQICIIKPTEPNDKFRQLRDKFGRIYNEKPLGDWTIIEADDYQLEETFWVFGYDPQEYRPTIQEVIKKLMKDINKKDNVKQVIVVHNKFIIYNEEQFDMVICKCIQDAQRLHHTLSKIATKNKYRNLLFMGTATPATISKLYPIIQEKTGWNIRKVRKTNTCP